MHSWLAPLRREGAFQQGASKYAAIADAISAAIRSGELRPGARLPPQRALADQLGVDLTTVTRAYGLLRQAGLIEGAGKLGSFVRNDAGEARPGETPSEIGMNVPPQPGFALLPEAIRTGTAALLRAGRQSPMLQYQPNLGSLLERQAAAAALSARGLPTRHDQVAITAGAQNALHGIVSTLLRPGDAVCCSPYLYPGMLALAHQRDLRLCPVAVDGEGMLPDALDQALRQGARTLYVTPTNDNPTSATMGPARRRAIADTARRHGATIIEDDAYGLLPSEPPAPIASLVPELSWHIAGTSKIISPILRVAHVRAPSAEAAARMGADLGTTAVMAPPLNAALISLWLRDGTFGRLVDGVRAEAVARQRIVVRCLKGLRYAAHPEGYHLWLDTPDPRAARELVASVAGLGLSIVPGGTFAADANEAVSQVRISVGGAIDHERLERALRRVRELLD